MSNPAEPHPTEAYPTQPYPAQSIPAQTYPTQSYPTQSYPAQSTPARVPAGAATGTTLATTNTFALLSIVFAFIAPLAAIIFGHLALNQIKRNGDAGRGIALTGTIIGYAYFVAILLFFIFYVGLLLMIFGTMGSALSSSGFTY